MTIVIVWDLDYFLQNCLYVSWNTGLHADCIAGLLLHNKEVCTNLSTHLQKIRHFAQSTSTKHNKLSIWDVRI